MAENQYFAELGIKDDRGLPWWLILIACFFFPIGYAIGLVVAFRKLGREKYDMVRNGKWGIGLGIGVFLVGLFFISLVITDEQVVKASGVMAGIIPFAVIFCLPGGRLMAQGTKYRKLGESLRLYAPFIINNQTGECSLDTMAAACNQSYETVCGQLEQLIKAGLLPNWFLNRQTHQLISSMAIAKERTTQKQRQETDGKKAVIALKCPNCGGVNNVREGESQPCEYCGTVLTCEKTKQDQSINTEKVFQDVNEMMDKMSDMMDEMFK